MFACVCLVCSHIPPRAHPCSPHNSFQVASFRYKGCLRQPRPSDKFEQFKPSALVFANRGRTVTCPEQTLLKEKRLKFQEWVQKQKSEAKTTTIDTTSNGGGGGGGSATTKSGNATKKGGTKKGGSATTKGVATSSKGDSGRLLVEGEGGAREGGAESDWAPDDRAHGYRMVIERQLGDCNSRKCKQAKQCFEGEGCSARGGGGQWSGPYTVRLRSSCMESRSAVHLPTTWFRVR